MDTIEEELLDSLKYVLEHFPKLKSDYARYNAFYIASLASKGLVTNINLAKEYMDFWAPSIKGYKLLFKLAKEGSKSGRRKKYRNKKGNK